MKAKDFFKGQDINFRSKAKFTRFELIQFAEDYNKELGELVERINQGIVVKELTEENAELKAEIEELKAKAFRAAAAAHEVPRLKADLKNLKKQIR